MRKLVFIQGTPAPLTEYFEYHPYSISSTSTPWSQSVSIPRFNSELGELIRVEIPLNVSWQGRLWFENTSGVGTRTLTADLASLTTIQVAGVDAVSGTTTSNFAPPTLSAFDGTLNYDGSSGYQFATRFGSTAPSITLESGDPGFSEFIGTGDADVVVSSSHSVTVNPVAGVSDPETLSILVLSKTAAGGYIVYTYLAP